MQPPPRPPAPRRRAGLIITAAVAVVALVAIGIVVVNTLAGRGGAATADQAVTLLAADLSDENYMGAFSRLHPAEAELFTDVGELVVDELKRLEVFRSDADVNSTAGTFTFDDLRFAETGAQQVRPNVMVHELVAGTITTEQNPADLPFTDSFIELAFPDGLPPDPGPTTMDIAEIVAEQGEPIRVATVEVDGQWYVSLYYTAADYALRAAGLSWPQQSIAPRGAADPQEALRATVQALLDGDVRRLVELAPPGELSVVHDVGEVLVSEASSASPSGVRLVELETAEVDFRGWTGLQLTRVVVENSDGEMVTLTRDGDCVSVAAGGQTQQFCVDDALAQLGTTVEDPALQGLLPALVRAALDVKIVTTEVDGAHYVSPTRTLVGVYADLFAVLSPEDLAALINSGR